MKDANGKMFVNEMIEVAKSGRRLGSIYVAKTWRENALVQNGVYPRVPGENAIVCAGIYE